MESLLSNYASSEDEDEQVDPKPQPRPPPPKPSTTSKSSPNFFSLPPPKSSCSSSSSSSSSSLFSSVPPPKATQPKPPPSGPNPKKVVQFKPPIDPSFFNSSNLRDDDDNGEPADRKPSKDSFSVSKSQPFVLPPPKHSFGLASSASRRALVHTETSTAAPTAATSGDRDKEKVFKVGSYEQGAENGSGSDHTTSDSGAGNAEYQNYENYGYYSGNTEDGSAPVMPYSNVGNEQYGDYGRCYSRYTADWAGGSGVSSVPAQPLVESIGRVKGKRGRNEVPTEIIEVKQDELMSNRPRENQTKMTGIAFGPAYQPVSSAKSKPSKLHKRKHQIGSLYFDMKQKEMELAERRAKGFQTKAETQGKYGW